MVFLSAVKERAGKAPSHLEDCIETVLEGQKIRAEGVRELNLKTTVVTVAVCENLLGDPVIPGGLAGRKEKVGHWLDGFL